MTAEPQDEASVGPRAAEPPPAEGDAAAGDGAPPSPHRVAARALIQAAVGGPVMAAVVSSAWIVVRSNSWDARLAFNFLVMSVGFCFVLSVVAGVARRLRRGLRPVALLVIGPLSSLVVGLGIGWGAGLVEGGPSAAFARVQFFLIKILDGLLHPELLGITAATVTIFVVLGALESDALPEVVRATAPLPCLHLALGAVAAIVASAAFAGIHRAQDEPTALWVGCSLGGALGLWVGGHVDAWALRRWRARADAD